MNKKKDIGALKIPNNDKFIHLKEDPAWIGLSETFQLGHPELSENVDALLYRLDGEN